MQGGRRGPGLGVSDGLWSQVINQAGALFPEPPLTPETPQAPLREQAGWRGRYGARGRGITGEESKCCAGVPRLGLGPDSTAL